MEKKQRQGYFNSTFILQVDNYFVMGNFLLEPEKAVCPGGRSKEKNDESFFFGAKKPVFFRHVRIVLLVRSLLEDYYFLYLFYFILFYFIQSHQY